MARVKITDLVNQNSALESKIKKIQVVLSITASLVLILFVHAFFTH